MKLHRLPSENIHEVPRIVGDTPRAVLTMRFSPTEVKADLDVWATFESSMARGVDRFQHNPEAKIPTGDACPVRSFQLSAEFA